MTPPIIYCCCGFTWYIHPIVQKQITSIKKVYSYLLLNRMIFNIGIRSKYLSTDVSFRFKVPWFIELRVMYQISQNLFQITRATHVDTYFYLLSLLIFLFWNCFYSKHGIISIIFAASNAPNKKFQKSWSNLLFYERKSASIIIF